MSFVLVKVQLLELKKEATPHLEGLRESKPDDLSAGCKLRLNSSQILTVLFVAYLTYAYG